jgi:hypothetical protein
MEEKKLPDVVLVLDRAIEQLKKLRKAAEKQPEFFNVKYNINRGLEYDINIGTVVKKNPEVTSIEIQQFT